MHFQNAVRKGLDPAFSISSLKWALDPKKLHMFEISIVSKSVPDHWFVIVPGVSVTNGLRLYYKLTILAFTFQTTNWSPESLQNSFQQPNGPWTT